jgi:hypothetical protein
MYPKLGITWLKLIKCKGGWRKRGKRLLELWNCKKGEVPGIWQVRWGGAFESRGVCVIFFLRIQVKWQFGFSSFFYWQQWDGTSY